MGTLYLISVILVTVNLKCVNSQSLPTNPCPDLFQYLQGNNIIYGRLEFPNDRSGNYELTVNMSVATLLTKTQNVTLELRKTTNELLDGEAVVYNVYFPIQNIIPKPTGIEFNGRVYCRSSPVEILPGKTITNTWSKTYFRIITNEWPIIPTSVPVPTWPTELTTSSKIEIAPTNTKPTAPVNVKPTTPAYTLSGLPYTAVTIQSPFTSKSNPAYSSNSGSFLTIAEPDSNKPFVLPNKPSNPPIGAAVVSGVTVGDNTVQQCGRSSVNVQSSVVNDFVKEGEFPWMVAIMYRKNSDYTYACTGSLVSNMHVITAAHCVQQSNAFVAKEDLLIVFGKVSLRNWRSGVTRYVLDFKPHPDYKLGNGDADIAVLTLQEPAEFGTLIQPVCLWQDNNVNITDQEGIVAGWNSNSVTDAKKINLPIVVDAICFFTDSHYADITSDRTFCAGKLDGSTPCTADNGSGFVMRKDGKWTLRGVVSIALKDTGTCAEYSIVADVAKFKSWLTSALM